MMCEQIFEKIKKNKTANNEFEVYFSMMEIYNEKIQDLLIPIKSRSGNGLKIREHAELGIYVEDLSKFAVASYEDIEAKVEEGT